VNLDDVQAAVTAVLTDLGHPNVFVGVRFDEDGLVELALPNGSLHGTQIEPDTASDRLVRVANAFQNDANFWLPDAWGEPLPRCPGHQHPLDPRVIAAEAWWICPATDECVARIGELSGR